VAVNTGIAQTALDNKGLAELRRSASQNQNDQETLSQVAGQFESLFLNMMLKSMRKASLAEGMFDSSQSRLYQDMADQQLSIEMSKNGGLGLKEVIMRQLGSQFAEKIEGPRQATALSTDTVDSRPALPDINKQNLLVAVQAELTELKENPAIQAIQKQAELKFDSPDSFVRQLWSMAEKAADKIGVSPAAILSQAALETGWGKHVIKKADQESSFNLFNIKADKRWQGDAASVNTVEFREGVAVKEPAKFRVYNSYQDSFDDYINFLQTQPRYREALKLTDDPEAFIEGLHDAGYATDPEYSDKIKRIMNSDTLAVMSQAELGLG